MPNTLSMPPAVGANAARPLLTTSTTLQWDANSGVCRQVELYDVLEYSQTPTFRVNSAALTALQARSYWTSSEICRVPFLPVRPIAWEQEASRLTFSLAAILLTNNAYEALARIASELLWFPSHQHSVSAAPSVHPVLFGHPPGAVFPMECINIVPSLQAHDPLQHHIALVLQNTITATSRAERLYAEALTDALMAHFLRRYAASQPVLQKASNGLVPYKLQRTLAYIQTHLARKLSLGALAHVAQMSPTHFAHLFKHTTGLSPHRYVVLCRIEHAKQLLGETDMPLIDIGPEVGFSDQSHFTALFRKHVSMTPKTYRDAIAQE